MNTSALRSLWRGEVALARVFWEFTIGWGTLVNLLCTGAALAAFVNGAHAWLGLALHFAATPLNILLLVSVFRAAARETENPLAKLAPSIAAIWFILMVAL